MNHVEINIASTPKYLTVIATGGARVDIGLPTDSDAESVAYFMSVHASDFQRLAGGMSLVGSSLAFTKAAFNAYNSILRDL